jgi:hypothetical protein
MKILRLTSAITLLVVVLSITTSAKPSDERDLATKIVGIWMPHPNEYGLFFKGGIQTFRADKTLIGAGAVGAGSRNREVQIEGKWWLEGNVLCEEVTKSSLPESCSGRPSVSRDDSRN